MKIEKTFVAVNDLANNTSRIVIADTIEHEGKKWLVPEWLEAPSEGWKKPARIICIESLPYTRAPKNYPGDHLLTTPLSTDVLDGKSNTVEGVEIDVIEAPDITFPIPKGIH